MSVFDDIDALIAELSPQAERTSVSGVPNMATDTLAPFVAEQESGGLGARRATAVSPKGAVGVMQIMPDTGREIAADLGEAYSPEKLRDPDTSARWGTYYLQKNKARYSDVPDEISDRLALTAYHAGPPGADQVYENYKRSGAFVIPRNKRFWDGHKYTADYVEEVMAKKEGDQYQSAPAGSLESEIDKLISENEPAPSQSRRAPLPPPKDVWSDIEDLAQTDFGVQPRSDFEGLPKITEEQRLAEQQGPVTPLAQIKPPIPTQTPIAPTEPGMRPLANEPALELAARAVPPEEKQKMPGVLESFRAGAIGIGKASNKFLSYLVGNEYTAALLGIEPENRKAAAEAVQKAIAQPVDDLYKMTGMEKGAEAQGVASKYLLSKEAWTKLENIPKTAKAVAAVAAYNGPQMVAAATPGVGQGSIIASEGGNWAEAAEQSGLEPKYVTKWMLTYAVPSGIVEVTTNKFLLGLGKLAKIDKAIGPITKKVAGVAAGKIATPLVKTAAGGTVEGLEELLQGNLQFGTLYLALLDNAKNLAKTDPEKGQQLLNAARTLKSRYSLKGNFEDFFLGALVGTVYKGASVAARGIAERRAVHPSEAGAEPGGPGVLVGEGVAQTQGGDETRVDILRRRIQVQPEKVAGPQPTFVQEGEAAELARQRGQLPMVTEQPQAGGKPLTPAERAKIPPVMVEETAQKAAAEAQKLRPIRYNPLRFNELAEKAGITTNKQLDAFRSALPTMTNEEFEEKHGALNDKEVGEFADAVNVGARITDIPERMKEGLRKLYESQGKEIPETLKPPEKKVGPTIEFPKEGLSVRRGKRIAAVVAGLTYKYESPRRAGAPRQFGFDLTLPDGEKTDLVAGSIEEARKKVADITAKFTAAKKPVAKEGERRQEERPVLVERRVEERRMALVTRKDLAEMTPEEKDVEIEILRKEKDATAEQVHAAYNDKVTGLGTLVAFHPVEKAIVEAERRGEPHEYEQVVVMDMGGLGWFNNTVEGGHNAGDALLKAFADHLKAEGLEGRVYRRPTGDEFLAIGDKTTEEKTKRAIERHKNSDFNITIVKGGVREVLTIKGPEVSYGTGDIKALGIEKAIASAESGEQQHKQQQVKQGIRAGSKAEPPEVGRARPTAPGRVEDREGGIGEEGAAVGEGPRAAGEAEPVVAAPGERGETRPIKGGALAEEAIPEEVATAEEKTLPAELVVSDDDVKRVNSGILDEYGRVKVHDREFLEMSPEERRKDLQKKRDEINRLLKGETTERNRQKLLIAKKNINRTMKRPEIRRVGVAKRVESNEKMAERIAENKITSQEASQILDDAQDFVDNANNDEINALLGKKYSEESINIAREAIKKGERDGGVAEDIRREVARQLLQGVKIGDVVGYAQWMAEKPSAEEIAKLEEEFGISAEPITADGVVMFKREREVREGQVRKARIVEDEAKKVISKYLSPELARRVRIRISAEFNPGEKAKIEFDKDGAIVTVNANLAANRVAKALVHEIPGHYGAIETMRQNAAIDARLRSAYKAAKDTRVMSELRDMYWDEGKTDEANERVMFLEWVAAQMEQHEAKPNLLTTRVWNAVKDWLISIGVKADDVDAVMRALVKEMKTARAQGTQAGVLASKYEAGDLFAGTESAFDVAKAKKKEDEAEIKRRLTEPKGGRADLEALPMFRGLEIEGTQQMTLFSREAQPADPSLVALHNLNQESILFADKMGGLPAPSIAVAKAGMPFAQYGDVTLIAKKDVIDPALTKVFNADIYSGRSPGIEHDINRKEANRFRAKLWPARKKYQDTTGTHGAEESIEHPNKDRFIDEAAKDDAMKGMFLEENGVKVEPVWALKKPYPEWATEPELIEWNKSIDWKKANDEAGNGPYNTMVRESFDSVVEKTVRRIYGDMQDASGFINRAIENAQARHPRSIHKAVDDYESQTKEIDKKATGLRLDHEIETVGQDKFKQWIEAKADNIFVNPHLLKGRTKLPVTLENMVDATVSGGLRGKEKNMVYGLGQARAASAKRIKSIQEMHKQEGRIVSQEAAEKTYEENQKRFFALQNRIDGYYKYARGGFDFGRLDDLSKAVADYLKGPKNIAGMQRALSKNGYLGVGEGIAEDMMDFANDLAMAPTQYFEAKPERAVGLNEFVGAVIPIGAKPEVREVLQKHGIDAVEYEKGSVEDRTQKTKSFATEKNALFSKDAPEFFSPTERSISEIKQEKGVVPQIESMIRKGQLKKAEVDWMGLEEWLKDNPNATKSEVLGFVQANKVQLKETRKGVLLLPEAIKLKELENLDIAANTRLNIMSQELGASFRPYLSGTPLRWMYKRVDGVVQDLPEEYVSEVEALIKQQKEYENYVERISDDFEESEEAPKFDQWQLGSGENYREILLMLPKSTKRSVYEKTGKMEAYGEAKKHDFHYPQHWDEANPVSHTRVNDRTTPNGEKVLFVEEVQSDWARELRDRGIKRTATLDDVTIEQEYPTGGFYIHDKETRKVLGSKSWRDRSGAVEAIESGKIEVGEIPDFPFKKNWLELTLKKLLRMAAEGGYKRMAWINGKQTSDRYDLSKQVDQIDWKFSAKTGRYSISPKKGGATLFEKDFVESELAGAIGKDAAEKIVNSEQVQTAHKAKGLGAYGVLAGDDLKVGGEWAYNLYDVRIPQFLEKYGKKWGVKVEDADIGRQLPAWKDAGSSNLVHVVEAVDEWAVRFDDGEIEDYYPSKEAAEKAAEALNRQNFPQLVQQSVSITDAMRKEVLEVGQPLFSKDRTEPMYSNVANALAKIKQERAPASQWAAMLDPAKGLGTKADENEWIGLNRWLKEKGNEQLTKSDVDAFINQNKIQLQEVRKGDAKPLMDEYNTAAQMIRDKYAVGENKNMNLSALMEIGAVDKADVDLLNSKWVAVQDARTTDTKFETYQVPGGENYREVLVTLPVLPSPANAPRRIVPGKEVEYEGLMRRARDLDEQSFKLAYKGKHGDANSLRYQRDVLENQAARLTEIEPSAKVQKTPPYHSSHWDEPNVLAHYRLNDRTIDGKKTLFVEEIQSDWHQEGRKKGYASETKPSSISSIQPDPKGTYKNIYTFDDGVRIGANSEEHAKQEWMIETGYKVGVGVPRAPFSKTWYELAFKKILDEAADKDYDKVAWTTGEQQAARYDLSKQLDSDGLSWQVEGNGKISIFAHTVNGSPLNVQQRPLQEFENIVGKDVTKQMADAISRGSSGGTIQGESLKVGGEGMKGFYDKILVDYANKYAKKWGSRVVDMPIEDGVVVHTLDITPAMRAEILTSGQPLFAKEKPDKATEDYIDSLEKEVRKVRGQLKHVVSEDAIQDRAAIQLWMDSIPNDAKDRLITRLDALQREKANSVRSAIIGYAQKIGLRGEPFNRVDTLVKNTTTIRGYQKALEIMDGVMRARVNRTFQKKVLELIENQYRRQRLVEEGKRRSPYTLETERELADYLEGLKAQKSTDVDLMLAYWGQYGQDDTKANRQKAVAELGEDVVAWLEDPSKDVPDGVKAKVKKLFRPSLGSMNNQQLFRVMRDIREIQRHGRLLREINDDARVDRLEADAVRIAQDIHRAMKKPMQSAAQRALENNYKKNVLRRITRVGDLFGEDLLYNTLDPERAIEGMVGFEESSPLKSLVWDPLWKASMAKLRNMKAALDRFGVGYKGIDIIKARTKPWKSIVVEGYNEKGEFGPIEIQITIANAMAIYGYAQNDGGRRHLQGTGILDGAIAEIVQDLPQIYKDAVEEQMDYYDEKQYQRINKVFVEQYGIDMPQEARYLPIVGIDSERAENEVLADVMARAGARTANVQKGFVKSRVSSMAPFKRLDYFDIVLKNLMAVEHYIAFQTAVNDVQRVLDNPVIKDAMKQKSEVAYGVLQKWVKAMALGKVGTSEHWYDKTADAIRSNYATYVLGFKITSILMQTASLPKAFAYISKKSFAKSLGSFARNPASFLSQIDELSAFMNARMRNFEREISEQFENQAYARALKSLGLVEKTRDAAMWVMGAYDKLLAGLVWHAKYQEIFNRTMDKEKAVDAADEVVRKTQSGGGLITLSAMYRGSGLVRLFSMFRSDANKTFNLAYEISHKAKKQHPGKTAEQIFWVFIVAPTVACFMRNALKWPWEEPEEYGKEIIRNVSDGIALLGDAIQAAANIGFDKLAELRGASPNKYWTRYIGDLNLPGVSAFGDLSEAIAKEKPALVVDAFAQLVGVAGYNQAKRTVTGIKEMGEKGPNWKYLIWPKSAVEKHTGPQIHLKMIEKRISKIEKLMTVGNDDPRAAEKAHNELVKLNEKRQELLRAIDRMNAMSPNNRE